MTDQPQKPTEKWRCSRHDSFVTGCAQCESIVCDLLPTDPTEGAKPDALPICPLCEKPMRQVGPRAWDCVGKDHHIYDEASDWPEPPTPSPALLQAAVDDCKAHPERYYKLEGSPAPVLGGCMTHGSILHEWSKECVSFYDAPPESGSPASPSGEAEDMKRLVLKLAPLAAECVEAEAEHARIHKTKGGSSLEDAEANAREAKADQAWLEATAEVDEVAVIDYLVTINRDQVRALSSLRGERERLAEEVRTWRDAYTILDDKYHGLDVCTIPRLEHENQELRAEYARATGVSEDDAWTLDVPPDDKTCVAEYRIRWLRVKMRAEKAERALDSAREALREAVETCASAHLVSIGSIDNVHAVHVGVEQVARWREALSSAPPAPAPAPPETPWARLCDLLEAAGAKPCFCLICKHQSDFGPCTACSCRNAYAAAQREDAPTPEATPSGCTCGVTWPCPSHGGPPEAPAPDLEGLIRETFDAIFPPKPHLKDTNLHALVDPILRTMASEVARLTREPLEMRAWAERVYETVVTGVEPVTESETWVRAIQKHASTFPR